MRCKNILIVESPLQLINAIEAISFFKILDYKIYIRYSNVVSNDKQINKLLTILSVDNVKIKTFVISGGRKKLVDIVKIIFYWFLLGLKLKGVQKLFVGNYDSPFLKGITRLTKRNNIILLDDGAKTIELQNNFSDHYSLDLFTMYDINNYSGQNIFINSFDYLRNKFDFVNTINQNSILFIGSKLVESGIVTEEYYLSLIDKISLSYSNFNIIYIPHRGENSPKLEQISKIENISLTSLDYPVEFYGIYEKKLPNKIISFYSTALLSMKKLYPNLEIISCKFDYSSCEIVEELNELYDYYSKYLIIIEL